MAPENVQLRILEEELRVPHIGGLGTLWRTPVLDLLKEVEI